MARPFRRPTRQITETVHGVDVAYDVPDTTPVIRLPFNLDATLRRALFALAIAMTAVAIVWGTVAIGSMLTLLAPPWAAYLVAGVFDAGWAACLVAEWLLRYDSKRAEIPMRVGVALLAVSMAAIVTHGALAGPWGWVIGIIGALVSAAAKGVWAVGMHTIRIKLEPKYEAYLNTRRQKAGTEMALALGERDRLLVEDGAVKLRLALEAQHPPAPVVIEEPVEAVSAPTPLPVAAASQGLREPAAWAPAPQVAPAPPVHAIPPRNPDPEGEAPEPGTVEDDPASAFAGRRRHHPIVYFIRNGSRVKIGTTARLWRRIENLSLRMSDVVHVEYGDRKHERQLHVQFGEYRVGNTEWFELRGALADYLDLPEQIAISPDRARERDREQIPNRPPVSENIDREQPSIADLAREQVAITANNPVAVEAILKARPEASKPSVAAAVRRARKAAQGPYL